MADSQRVPMPSVEARSRRSRLTQSDWNIIRPSFEMLWCREGRSLSEVMTILSRDYAFDATESQYKKKISQWSLKKYLRGNEVEAIIQKESKRKAEGKDSEFEIRGQYVTPEKIARRKRRKVMAEPQLSSLPNPTARTPPDIVCFTPPPLKDRSTQSDGPMGQVLASRANYGLLPAAYSNEDASGPSEVPWPELNPPSPPAFRHLELSTFDTYDLPEFPEPEWFDPTNLLADATKPMSLTDDFVPDWFEFTSLEDQMTDSGRLASPLDLEHAFVPNVETLALEMVDKRRTDPTNLMNSDHFPACPPHTLTREKQQHTSLKASVPVTGALGDIADTILESVERADPGEDNIEQRNSVFSTKRWERMLAEHEFRRNVDGSQRGDWHYRKVAVLMLSWSDEVDDLGCASEVNKLSSIFRDKYNFNVTQTKLHNHKNPQVQLGSKLNQFIEDNDDPNNLLMVYYAGHGIRDDRDGGLLLAGSRPWPEIDKSKGYPALVSWDKAEKSLLDFAEADVLTLFDCCNAGAGVSRTVNGHRTYETLSATDERGVTPTPGPESFTSALIDSLEELRDGSHTAFSTTDLQESMAKKLPLDRRPILNNRSSQPSSRHLMLEPLSLEDKNDAEAPPKASWALVFDIGCDHPTPAQARDIANDLPRVFQDAGVPLHDIRWQTLTPYATAEEPPGSALK